jgi:hypothetical protein
MAAASLKYRHSAGEGVPSRSGTDVRELVTIVVVSMEKVEGTQTKNLAWGQEIEITPLAQRIVTRVRIRRTGISSKLLLNRVAGSRS